MAATARAAEAATQLPPPRAPRTAERGAAGATATRVSVRMHGSGADTRACLQSAGQRGSCTVREGGLALRWRAAPGSRGGARCRAARASRPAACSPRRSPRARLQRGTHRKRRFWFVDIRTQRARCGGSPRGENRRPARAGSPRHRSEARSDDERHVGRPPRATVVALVRLRARRRSCVAPTMRGYPGAMGFSHRASAVERRRRRGLRRSARKRGRAAPALEPIAARSGVWKRRTSRATSASSIVAREREPRIRGPRRR